jgi:signal transduction histidine kinase
MAAAGAAALLALRNAQLSAVVRASVRDLHASRARIATAGDEARRRLERDVAMHAERRLEDVHEELARAAEAADAAEVRDLLGALADEAAQTRASVRTTAQGIYPALLAEEGIGRALAAHLNGAPNVVIREAAGTLRFRRDRESAVFFSCLEAVQNALKHAGSGARITISLTPVGRGVRFVVQDDGCGYEAERTPVGAGVTNIRDRIEAVGGRVRIVSVSGQGTTVTGTV